MKWHLSVAQGHLLRAALCRGEVAHDAWHTWCATTDFEQLDVASYRLLPLLWRNLQANQLESVLMPRLQGIYRRTWVENQLLFSAVDEAVDALGQLDLLWLGEAALAKKLYGEWGVRPLAHVTVGCSAATRHKLAAALRKAGWQRHFSPRQLWHQVTRALCRSIALPINTSCA